MIQLSSGNISETAKSYAEAFVKTIEKEYQNAAVIIAVKILEDLEAWKIAGKDCSSYKMSYGSLNFVPDPGFFQIERIAKRQLFKDKIFIRKKAELFWKDTLTISETNVNYYEYDAECHHAVIEKISTLVKGVFEEKKVPLTVGKELRGYFKDQIQDPSRHRKRTCCCLIPLLGWAFVGMDIAIGANGYEGEALIHISGNSDDTNAPKPKQA